MRKISNADLKVQLTNEYLRSGGLEKILSPELLQDIINFRLDSKGKAIPGTITPRLNAFMLTILGSHSLPPLLDDEHISEYKSFVQKSLFFDQVNIDTEEQIDELFEKFKESDKYLFRGQREAKWRLYSSLQRFWVWDKFEKDQDIYNSFLKKMVCQGEEEFGHNIKVILDKIHIDSLNDLAILGFLQHHGCPTPLLDWTYSFENALFFGIDGIDNTDSIIEINNYFSIYHIEESHFGQGGMKSMIHQSLTDLSPQLIMGLIDQIAENEDTRKEMIEKFKNSDFFDRSKLTGSGLIKKMTEIDTLVNFPLTYFSDKDISDKIAFSLYNSENIVKQDGVFTWNNSFNKPLEVIGQEQYNEVRENNDLYDYRFSDCYNINKKLEPYIRKKLADMGIVSETIYPDKDSDTKHVYEDCKLN